MADNRQFPTGAGSDPLLRMRESPTTPDLLTMIVLAGEHTRDYISIQTVPVVSGVTSLTVPSGATHADIYLETSVQGGYVRYLHAVNPSSTSGIRLFDNEQIVSAQPSQFRVTNGSSTGPVLTVNYYRYI